MLIRYDIVITLTNLVAGDEVRFNKELEANIELEDRYLYDNHHILVEGTPITRIFSEEISDYCDAHNIQSESLEVEEFEINSLTDNVDVYFENPEDEQNVSFSPIIKAYVHPRLTALKIPVLNGMAYDSTTIIWSWPNDMEYAHYLVEDPTDSTVDEQRIIATIPIGASTYTETGLEAGSYYTRRLINYTAEQTSSPSEAVTIMTEPVSAKVSATDYVVRKQYDFTTDDADREEITQRLKAFHSGIGHGNDLKVYKQMDSDFKQKFETRIEISGKRIQRERRYDQVGFNYKVCLEAKEEIEEQEGEVTFDVNAYPAEWIRLKDYAWQTAPVYVQSRMQCDVFLRKPIPGQTTETVTTLKPIFSTQDSDHDYTIPGQEAGEDVNIHEKFNIAGQPHIVFVLDVTSSLKDYTIGKYVDRMIKYKSNSYVDYLKNTNNTDRDAKWNSFPENKYVFGVYGMWSNSSVGNLNQILNRGTDSNNKRRVCGFGDIIHNNLVGNLAGSNNTLKIDDSYPPQSMGAIRYIKDKIIGMVSEIHNYVKSSKMYLPVIDPSDPDYDPELGYAQETKHYTDASDPNNPQDKTYKVPKYRKKNGKRLLAYPKYGLVLFAKDYYYPVGTKWLSERKLIRYLGDDSGNYWNKMPKFDSDSGKYTDKGPDTDKLCPWLGGYGIDETFFDNDHKVKKRSSFTSLAKQIAATTNSCSLTDQNWTCWESAVKGAVNFLQKANADTSSDDDNDEEEESTFLDSKTICCFFSDGLPNYSGGKGIYKKNGSSNLTIKAKTARKFNGEIKTPKLKKVNNEIVFDGDLGNFTENSQSFTVVDGDTVLTNLASVITSEGFFTKFDYTMSFLCCDPALVTKAAFYHDDTYNNGTGSDKKDAYFPCTKDSNNYDYECVIEGLGASLAYEKPYGEKVTYKMCSYEHTACRNKADAEEKKLFFRWNDKDMDKAMLEFYQTLEGEVNIEHHGQEGWDPTDTTVFDGTKVGLEGWEEVDGGSEIVTYDLDDFRVERITYNFPMYEFNSTVTPVQYSPRERRAIIPSGALLEQTPIENKSLWDIIWPKVQQTNSYRAGYTETIGTVESSAAEPDTFLVKNLYIQDTYKYHDGTSYDGPTTIIFEDGWEGSVNVYTDVDRLGDNYYGNDCYLVKKKSFAEGGNPVYIQGYTDAIIYDAEKYIEQELNAYDRPSVVLSTSNGSNYGRQLINRKNQNLTLPPTSAMYHAYTLIHIDPDIALSGEPSDKISDLLEDGFAVFNPSSDFIASISKWYKSPVLNYRFNLEDPDARCPLFEIIPDCDPNSPFPHTVILHIYYADNVFITTLGNYVQKFGESPIATTASPFMYRVDDNRIGIGGGDENALVENLYKWSMKEWQWGPGTDNRWFLSDYVWFMAKPMRKIIDYYDELPKGDMEPFYGLVNGRYSSSNANGMRDLRVQAPMFNIPTTVTEKHANTIQIHVNITEFSPSWAIVSYKWDHPSSITDSITQVNGDYLTFHSDSVTYKDIPYVDTLSTIEMGEDIISDTEDGIRTFHLAQPQSSLEYVEYYLDVHSNNSDVMPVRWPRTIEFTNGTADIGVLFKCIVNSTSKWSPRIHNGHYYINQKEYYAYSEFDVDANFEKIETSDYKRIDGYVAINVSLRRPAGPREDYSVSKKVRSELMTNEKYLQLENGKGLTLKPAIDGQYYKEYYSFDYISQILAFPNVLTTAGRLKVSYSFDDGTTALPMKVRSYMLDQGEWSDWYNFENNTVPTCPLGFAYQVKFTLQATTKHNDMFLEDYMCCYLDWMDDVDEQGTINLSMITDHLVAGPDEATGVYKSKIIDNGCVTAIKLSMFCTAYATKPILSVAVEDVNPDVLLDENVTWIQINDDSMTVSGRFYRYKVEVPYGEKVYWIHKELQTKKTEALLPHVTGIEMTGSYQPVDTTDSFSDTLSFTMPADTNEHLVTANLLHDISADVFSRGFVENEIEAVSLVCMTDGVTLVYDNNINTDHPLAYLSSPIYAKSISELYTIKSTNTPYIYSQEDLYGNECVVINGTPQQYSPISVEGEDNIPYTELVDGCDTHLDRNAIREGLSVFMRVEEQITLFEDTKYYELKRNDYEEDSLRVYVNAERLFSGYTTRNHLVIFDTELKAGDVLYIEYRVPRSFLSVINRETNTTTLYIYRGKDNAAPEGHRKKYKVFFETNKLNNKFVASDLSFNPVYRTEYDGFVYLTDDHNEPYKINIFCNPTIVKSGGYDRIDISVEVLDLHDNPVINKTVEIDCDYGILTPDDTKTDINGVIHLIYESAPLPCVDEVRVRTTNDSGNDITARINITSKE